MARISEKCTALHQNLIDAGCDAQLIAHCSECLQSNRLMDLRLLLLRQRKLLLEDIHSTQKKLDCLDFLVHNIDKKKVINKEK